MKTLHVSLCVALLIAGTTRIGFAQNAEAPAAANAAAPSSLNVGVPLNVDIVVSRFTGEKADKKVSSAPYSMAVTARQGLVQQAPLSSIRMGNRVPISNSVFPSGSDGKTPPPITSFQYQDVGVNIDCRASARPDGRYEILLGIEETTVAPTPPQVQGVQTASPPVIRTLRFNDTVVVREGETRQFTAATDRVTSETVKIEVTVRAAK